MDNRFEFAIGSAHQVPTNLESANNRVVHSNKLGHSGSEEYKFGYVNDLTPCNECKEKIHG